MRTTKIIMSFVGGMLAYAASASHALPLVISLTEVNSANANLAIVTSASNPFGTPTDAFYQPGLADEAFSMNNRTHEYTAVRTTTAGILSNSQDAVVFPTLTLQPFPSYLNGLEYIQIANENRQAANYSIDVTLSRSVTAYLFLDNRNDGNAGNTNKTNTTDPTLGGNLAWVVNDGWTRVNTGFMPNGQADYIGIDEGATVAAGPTARTHAVTANLIAGSGNGLNNFYAIYTKTFGSSSVTGITKQQNLGGNNMYGIAFADAGPLHIDGDTDGDGIGGEFPADFNPIRDNFRKSPRTRAEGDLTGNGLVNFDDFRQWKAAALGSGVSLEGLDLSFVGAVPEPSALVLALLGLVGLGPRRGRR